MRATAALLTLCVGMAACAPPIVVRDRDAACRVARDLMRGQMSGAELVELTAPFPKARKYAMRSYDAKVAALVLTGLGAAGLVGSFVTGFAADTSRPEIRGALGGVVGTTIGLGVGALIAGAVTVRSRTRALQELDAETRAECP